MAKVLALTLAIVIISALAVLLILKVADAVHNSMAERKVRKLNEKLDQLEGN